MSHKQLIERLRQFNEWRRGADIGELDTRQIGLDIDEAIKILESLDTGEES